MSNWRTTRKRLAPIAARTAISRCRPSARDSSRFATFVQAISSTMPTAATRMPSVVRTFPTTCSSSGTIENVNPPFGGYSCGCSRRSRAVIRSISACAAATVTPRQRQKDVAVLGHAQRRQHLTRQREMLQQDADDATGLAVERDGTTDDLWVEAIAPRPRTVTEHRRAFRPGRILRGNEQPSKRGLRPQHRQQVGRGTDDADPLGVAAAGERVVTADRDRDLVETGVAVLDVEVLCGGKPVLGDVESGGTLPEDHQPIGVLVRQRAKQQRARDAEERGVGADTDGQRQNRGEREARMRHEPANRVPEIVEHRLLRGRRAERHGRKLHDVAIHVRRDRLEHSRLQPADVFSAERGDRGSERRGQIGLDLPVLFA